MKRKNISYKYIDGRFLKFSNIGDGFFELILIKDIDKYCLFDNRYSLDELLFNCNGIYDEYGIYISDNININDFNIEYSDIKNRNK